MESYGKSPTMEAATAPTDRPAREWKSPADETGLEEAVWGLGLGGRDSSYPERPGEANCIYYMRTGTCGYGARCRFNHPLDRGGSSTVGVVLQGGEFPEREGQPVCQYFLKTGTCKFGASCKYHHPKQGGGPMSSLQLNYQRYPLRPGEKECSYYMKTGLCKFGITCKFHHPQPAGASVPAPAPAPAFYQTVQSPLLHSTTPQYGVAANWPVTRPPVLPGSYLQGPYGPMMLSHGMLPLAGWNAFQAPVSPVAASPSTQLNAAAGPFYGISQLSPSAPAYGVSYHPVSSSPVPLSSNQKETIFPERPGEPECQHYMRTGDCKFGSLCKYHHPPELMSTNTNFFLNPMGLPLRMGAPPCAFYANHGVCKFGPLCKFDHSMGLLRYSPSASSLGDVPVAPYPVGSSLSTLAPSFSSPELQQESIIGSDKDTHSIKT